MYMWANSISNGVSRERGGGFTVTEITLEFRTVVFLGSQGRVRGSRSPLSRVPTYAQCPCLPTSPRWASPTPAQCPPLKGQEAAQVPVEHGAHHKHR